MTFEEIVEMTPGPNRSELARQLLDVAARNDNPYRITDVKTTTAGPLGLAFLVPAGLYHAWQQSLGVVSPPPPPETQPETKKTQRRARRQAAEE